MTIIQIIAIALLSFTVPLSFAQSGRDSDSQEHSGHGSGANAEAQDMDKMSAHEHGDSQSDGQPGDPAKVSRTVTLTMNDNLRFDPDKVTVKKGEIIRFLLINRGAIEHEMVIGSKQELLEHAEMMRSMPNMKRNEPNMIRLQPSKRGAIVWRFTQAGTVDFACLIPGHMEAGMLGSIDVKN